MTPPPVKGDQVARADEDAGAAAPSPPHYPGRGIDLYCSFVGLSTRCSPLFLRLR